MTVGTAAKRAGVNIDTMRYHERQGLLPKPPRTAGGYRALTEAAVDGLRFVKQAQALGLTLNDCSIGLTAAPEERSGSNSPVQLLRNSSGNSSGKTQHKHLPLVGYSAG